MKKALSNAIKKTDIYLVILIILTIILCRIFSGHTLSLLNDWGREFCFPEAVKNGHLLYRDIFNLFGALPYYINAILYCLFGTTLKIHYILGYITSILIICGTYMISNIYLSKKDSFVITLFAMCLGAGSAEWSNCNYFFPYTYAMTYGLISFLISIYFATLGFKEKKPIYFSLAGLAAGFAVSCKYEFILYALIFIGYSFYFLRKNIKLLFIEFMCFLFFPVITLGTLIYQGLTLQELKQACGLIRDIVDTPAYRYFYTLKGAIFSITHLKTSLYALLYTAPCIILFYSALLMINKNKIAGSIFLILPLFTTYKVIENLPLVTNIIHDSALIYLPVVTALIFFISIRKLTPDKQFIILSCLSVSLKCFWSAHIHSYGNYFLPLLLIGLYLMFENINIRKSFSLFIIILTSLLFAEHYSWLSDSCYPIYKNKDKIYTTEETGKPVKELVDYIKNNTKKTDKIIIFPEGLIINYLTDRKTEYYIYAIQPPYVQLFGEKKIIEKLKVSSPEYFIMYNETFDYYNEHENYCNTYAKEICNYIFENYIFAAKPCEFFTVYKKTEQE